MHGGTWKAGSTAIQEFLAANRTQRAGDGVDYFRPLKAANHAALAAAFCTRPTSIGRSLGVTTEADREKLRRWLARRIERSLRPEAVWLASSEHVGTLLRDPAEVRALHDYLVGFFDEVHVVAVLRRADHWLPSSYVESIKAGGTHALDADFVDSRRRMLNLPRLLAGWEEAFEAPVRAVPFLEADKRDVRILPQRVLAAAGLSAGTSSSYVDPHRLSNESISAYATEVLRLANPILRTSRLRPVSSRRRAIQEISRRWPGPGTTLTPHAAEAVDRAGWLRTGIEQSRFAVGQGWSEWLAQPPAPVRPQAALTEAQRQEALDDLHRARLVRSTSDGEPHGSWLDGAAAAARRATRAASRLR